jgi:hypothetical protein
MWSASLWIGLLGTSKRRDRRFEASDAAIERERSGHASSYLRDLAVRLAFILTPGWLPFVNSIPARSRTLRIAMTASAETTANPRSLSARLIVIVDSLAFSANRFCDIPARWRPARNWAGLIKTVDT